MPSRHPLPELFFVTAAAVPRQAERQIRKTQIKKRKTTIFKVAA
jgi:hypothetical protein